MVAGGRWLILSLTDYFLEKDLAQRDGVELVGGGGLPQLREAAWKGPTATCKKVRVGIIALRNNTTGGIINRYGGRNCLGEEGALPTLFQGASPTHSTPFSRKETFTERIRKFQEKRERKQSPSTMALGILERFISL